MSKPELKEGANAASQQAKSAPDGYVLVPIEPTREMKDAGKYTMKGSADEPDGIRAQMVYQQMLSVAPPTPQQAKSVLPVQEPLGADFEQVLHDNLDSLYETVAAPQQANKVLELLESMKNEQYKTQYYDGWNDAIDAALKAMKGE